MIVFAPLAVKCYFMCKPLRPPISPLLPTRTDPVLATLGHPPHTPVQEERHIFGILKASAWQWGRCFYSPWEQRYGTQTCVKFWGLMLPPFCCLSPRLRAFIPRQAPNFKHPSLLPKTSVYFVVNNLSTDSTCPATGQWHTALWTCSLERPPQPGVTTDWNPPGPVSPEWLVAMMSRK